MSSRSCLPEHFQVTMYHCVSLWSVASGFLEPVSNLAGYSSQSPRCTSHVPRRRPISLWMQSRVFLPIQLRSPHQTLQTDATSQTAAHRQESATRFSTKQRTLHSKNVLSYLELPMGSPRSFSSVGSPHPQIQPTEDQNDSCFCTVCADFFLTSLL